MRHTIFIMLNPQKATAENVHDMAEAHTVADAALDVAGFHMLDQADERMLAGLVIPVEALEALDALVVGSDMDAGSDVGLQAVKIGG